MSGPPSRTDLRGWHERIEHYSPDGTLGRLLFGAIVGFGFGSFLFFAGIAQVSGPLSAFLLSELVGLAAMPAGAALMTVALVVLWPVYLSLIGNIESTSTYGDSGKSERKRSSFSVRPSPQRQSTEAAQIKVLEELYSTGDISRETFERRLDEIVNGGTRRARPNRDAVEANAESEVE